MNDDTPKTREETELAAELEGLAGARVDAVHASPETGLIAVVVYAGEKKILGAGIGPDVSGVAFLPRLPKIRAASAHPLVAAMRAHLLGHRVRSAGIEAAEGDGAVWITVAGPEGGEARLVIHPGRRGEARVFAASGNPVLRWPPPASEPVAPKQLSEPVAPPPARALAIKIVSGADLVDRSDQRSAARAKTTLARAVKTKTSALERRVEAITADLARLGEIQNLQRVGRLLLAQGSKIPRGADRASLNDWETGGTIDIPLDPALPAKSQAERFFAKARRYQRGEAIMKRRLADAERALAAVRALAAEIDASPPDAAALDPLAAKARALGVSAAPETAAAAPSGRASKKSPERKPFHTFRSDAGRPILVGRGGADNDALTTRHARPHDLWLHAKGITGAHVIVPLEKGASCPPDLLVDAATLAAHFSDARGEAVCDVSYVERRHVRKPRKSAPGAVTFEREKVIAVRVEPERLERLLATKETAG